jgi:hypothetical protein
MLHHTCAPEVVGEVCIIGAFVDWRLPPLPMADRAYTLFFTGNDDPRHCIIIGEDTKPIYIEFQTTISSLSDTRTTVGFSYVLTWIIHFEFLRFKVYKDEDSVATLYWTMDVHLGRASIGSRQLSMSELVIPSIKLVQFVRLLNTVHQLEIGSRSVVVFSLPMEGGWSGESVRMTLSLMMCAYMILL